MNVLVTGGAGYIGSHTCKELWRAGYTPITYDNLSRGHAWAVKWGPLEKGDLGDLPRLRAVLQRWKPFAILHFAATSSAGESLEIPATYYHNNVMGTCSLLHAMLEVGLKRIIFSSSAAVYGIASGEFVAEHCPHTPINPYGRTKSIIEQMISDYHEAYGIQAVVLRYFNAAGADEEGDIGEAHEEETHLIPRVLDAALAGGEKAVTIFGGDYHTPDGTCIRDYVHVTDLARAHVAALQKLDGQNALDIYNLGGQQGFSVKEIVDRVSFVTGRKILQRIGPRRPGDPSRLVADATKAKRELEWQPLYSSIESIVDTAWRWTQRSQHDGYFKKVFGAASAPRPARFFVIGKT